MDTDGNLLLEIRLDGEGLPLLRGFYTSSAVFTLPGSRRMIGLATTPLLHLNTICPSLPLNFFSFS